MIRLVALGLLLPLGLSSAVWLGSLARHDASLADRFWPLFIAAPACFWAARLGPALAPDGRSTWMLAVLIAWAVRLAIYITRRNWGHGEDRRYRDMRQRNAPNFGLKSIVIVFGLQAVLAWIVALPFAAGAAAERPWNLLDGIGLAIGALGVVFEAMADAQMAAFRADPGHRGQVMDRGLWRYSRHPNYFGETCVWWGLWLMAVGGAGAGGAWTIVSPLLMTFLLLRVSGVSLLEKDIGERRPAYRGYIERTSAFVPWRPRRNAASPRETG